tara:strand:+ start:260 stop:964 length:705 start_codon:yes stop_codon:yes gene_type:complete
MKNEDNFEVFLYYSDNKLSISVRQIYNESKFYERSIVLDKNQNNLKLDELDEFLDLNIFKIEKSLKRFIKNITLIIEHQELLKITLSLKKKNYGNYLSSILISSLLKDARNQIKENNNNRIITHMVIDKYLIDGKYFLHLPENIKCENLCLDIDFICLSEDFVKKFEQSLSKYQIKIKQIISADYIKDYFKGDEIDIFSMCQKIIQGHNRNEILLVPKKTKNKGFFEKFFNLFS